MSGGGHQNRGDDNEISAFLASKSCKNINFDRKKHGYKSNDCKSHLPSKFEFSCNPCGRKKLKCWYFFCIFGRKQPMRRELANSILKTITEIKQIGGFTNSFSRHGRVWTRIVRFVKLIPHCKYYGRASPPRGVKCWKGSQILNKVSNVEWKGLYCWKGPQVTNEVSNVEWKGCQMLKRVSNNE